jgi:hypothetical protein
MIEHMIVVLNFIIYYDIYSYVAHSKLATAKWTVHSIRRLKRTSNSSTIRTQNVGLREKKGAKAVY